MKNSIILLIVQAEPLPPDLIEEMKAHPVTRIIIVNQDQEAVSSALRKYFTVAGDNLIRIIAYRSRYQTIVDIEKALLILPLLTVKQAP